MKAYPYLNNANTPFVDRQVTKASDIIQPWNGEEITSYGIIGAPLSKSSISHSGACFAPATIRKSLSSYSTYSIEEDVDLSKTSIVDVGDISMHVTNIPESQKRIEETMTKLLADNPSWVPILLGGDHSVSYPSIRAFSKTRGVVGVIQFDAHHDLRNLEDGGPSNGTPFRSLIESNSINGNNLIQIGIRDFSNSRAYSEYGEEHGVTIYTMKDVEEKSIIHLLDEVINKLKQQVDVIYVSVDMDVLDQAHAPGCPAIGPGGMDSATLLKAVSYLGQQDMVKGIDIVEIDPTLDFRDMTSRAAAHVILNFLKGKLM